MQNMHIAQSAGILYIFCIYAINKSLICTCSGRRMLWTLIPLLSSGIAGKPKEVYKVSWYSYRKRAILSGSTRSTAYVPNSRALPCRIIQSMVTQVVTATSSQSLRVGHEAPNLGSVPNVDSNACEIATRRDGIWSGRTLVPAVCSEGHTVACPMIYNSPGVDFFSVVNSSWKIQQYENYFKYVQYEQYAKYAENCKICQICLTIGPHSPYLVQLRTAMNWLPCARNATSYSTVLEALDWCRHLVVLPRSCGPLRERHNLHW